jgi:hypothetical protein
MKNTDPVMGAKLKSKTHLKNTLFEPFLRIWLQSSKFAKSANMTKKCTQKSYKQNKFDEHK